MLANLVMEMNICVKLLHPETKRKFLSSPGLLLWLRLSEWLIEKVDVGALGPDASNASDAGAKWLTASLAAW